MSSIKMRKEALTLEIPNPSVSLPCGRHLGEGGHCVMSPNDSFEGDYPSVNPATD